MIYRHNYMQKWGKIERNKEIIRLRKKGFTMQRIADIYRISKQRVWAIIRSYPQQTIDKIK